jgi:hypothetical protein
MFFSKKALNQISGIKSLDQLSRVYVLEGVLGVKAGSLARNPKKSLIKMRDKLPDLAKEWTELQESNLVRASLKGLNRYTQNISLDPRDLFFQYMLEKVGSHPNRLYYIGQTNAEAIKSGSFKPIRVGFVYGTFLKRKALSEIKKSQSRKEVALTPETRGDEGASSVKEFAQTVDFQDPNTTTNILISMLMDASSPLSNRLYKTIEETIDRFPFEKIKESKKDKSLKKFLQSFASTRSRLPVDKLKSEAILYLTENPTPRNSKILDKIEKLDEDKIIEFATQRANDPNLRREAYKAFVSIIRTLPAQEWGPHVFHEFKKDPERFWVRRFSKINRKVSIALGLMNEENYATSGDTRMTRILGVGGRNVIAFLSKIVSKDKKIQKILKEAVSSIGAEWGYSRKQASKKRVLNAIKKVAKENRSLRETFIRYYLMR